MFTSIYAEGYPRDEDLRLPEDRILDLAERLAYNRRYADRRFYKGTELVDVVEALACRRAAECFSTPEVPPEEIYVIRRGLELIVVEQAIEKATEEQIAEMRRVLARYRERLQAEPDTAHGDEHTRFHQIMVQSTGNRVLMDLLDPITVFHIPYNLGTVEAQPADMSAQEAFIRKHERIVEAIERRDLDAARAAMIEHLGDLEQRVRRVAEAELRSEKA